MFVRGLNTIKHSITLMYRQSSSKCLDNIIHKHKTAGTFEKKRLFLKKGFFLKIKE